MISLKQVSKEIIDIIKKNINKLEEKYNKIDLSSNDQGVFLTCVIKNGEKIIFRVIEDSERTTFTPPKSSKEYQEQGGHEALLKKMERTNPNAWKIEVTKTINYKNIEIAFSGNENNWSADAFEKKFLSVMID